MSTTKTLQDKELEVESIEIVEEPMGWRILPPKDAMELEVGIIGRLRKEAKSKVITETSAQVSNKVKIE